jgi:hypothetical protein
MIMQYGTSFTRIILEYRVVVRVSATKDKLGKLSHGKVAKKNHSNSFNNQGVQMTLTLTLALALMFKSNSKNSLRSYSKVPIRFLDEMSIGRTDFPDNCCKLFHYLDNILLSSYSVMSSISNNVENNGFHSKLVQYGMDVVSLMTNSQ